MENRAALIIIITDARRILVSRMTVIFAWSVAALFFSAPLLVSARKTNPSDYPFGGNLTEEMMQLNELNAPPEILYGPPDPVVCVMLCKYVDKPKPKTTLCEWEYWSNKPTNGEFGMLDKWHKDDSLALKTQCSQVLTERPKDEFDPTPAPTTAAPTADGFTYAPTGFDDLF